MHPRFLIIASVLVFTGCASVPAEFATQMDRTSDKYAMATTTMTRAQLVAALGPPQKEEEAKAVWEIRFDSRNYDSLTVDFTGDGRVRTMTKAHGRGSWSPHWSSQRSYAYEK
jgi:hypothetical protein